MISIIIPTIRPQNIPKLLEAIKASTTVKYQVIVEEDTERIGAPKMVKKLVDKADGEWIVFLGDDTLPENHCIDNAFAYANEQNLWLVGFNDGHGQKATHWIANKKLLDHLENREFFYTGYIHNFCDDELRMHAQRLGKYGWCETAGITHNHPAFGTASSETYKKQQDSIVWSHDQKLFQERNCTLSVAIIAKNEGKVLAKCLESVKGADEIVLVDTGSNDDTIKIAGEYSSHVYTFPWCDDFSAARNFALRKCTSNWVLSIDCDEVLEEGGIQKIKDIIGMVVKDSIGIRMQSGPEQFIVPRLFRNTPTTKWEGRIHEVINKLDYDVADIHITYGFSPAHELDPERNMRILQADYVANPQNTRSLFYLAREFGYRKEWVKAAELFEQYFPIATWLPEKADAYFMCALCYWNNGEGEKAREKCLMAININANFKAALLLMARMSWEHNAVQWRKMAETATNENTLFIRHNFDTL